MLSQLLYELSGNYCTRLFPKSVSLQAPPDVSLSGIAAHFHVCTPRNLKRLGPEAILEGTLVFTWMHLIQQIMDNVCEYAFPGYRDVVGQYHIKFFNRGNLMSLGFRRFLFHYYKGSPLVEHIINCLYRYSRNMKRCLSQPALPIPKVKETRLKMFQHHITAAKESLVC